MPMTKKVPISEVDPDRAVPQIVENKLRSDSRNGYTILGLMVECFGVPEADIASKPFNRWKKGQPTLYSRIRKALDNLIDEGKVKHAKKGRAVVYWYNGMREAERNRT